MSDEDQNAAPGTDPGAQKKRRRTIAWIAGGAVAVLAIGTGIAFAVIPRDAQAGPKPSGSTSSSPSSSAASEAPDPSASATPSPTPPAESNPFPELDPVAPDQPGAAEGIGAELVKFESVTGEVTGPGDVAAAAVRVTIDYTNTGTAPLDLNLIVVNGYMGAQRDPAETYEHPGGSPVSGSLEPGKTATGVYLFRIPEDRRDDVTFVVDYHAGMPAITFRGPVP